MTDKLATFRLDGDLWKAFQAKAKGDNTDASTLLRAYVQSYLDGSIDGIDSRIDSRLERIEQRLGELSAA